MTLNLLDGEVVPSSDPTTHEQVARYERTDGREGATLQGAPVVILTTRGARSGKLRKVALMRTERGGVYAVGAAETGDREVPLVLLEPATT